MSKIYMKSKLGNIYANLIKEKNKPINPDTDHILHSDIHYKDNKIDWALNTQKDINHYMKIGDDPKSLDSIFLFKLGSEETHIPNF